MAAPPARRSPESSARLRSIDAYRGLVMLAIASGGLGIAQVARQLPDSQTWQATALQFEHVPWVGCVFWDLIQPSFMFLVGVAMAFSYAKRAEKGDSYGRMLRHAIVRSLVLVALSILLASNWSNGATNFVFVNVLAQIGLGYTFVFFVLGLKRYEQLIVALVILAGYWALFYSYPAPEPGTDYVVEGLPDDIGRLHGIEAHWSKHTNAAAVVDQWLLNLFPRKEPYEFNVGGYQTLNFIPSIATMIFGLMTGELLRGPRRKSVKLLLLILFGLAGLGIGWGAAFCFDLMTDQQTLPQLAAWASQWSGGAHGICPLVKRIWTPTWAIYSAGWACLIMAGFYLLIDIIPIPVWSFPLVVVGANPLTMYMMSQLLKPWTWTTVKIHFGWWLPGALERLPLDLLPAQAASAMNDIRASLLGETFQPMVQTISVVLVFWAISYWLYRQRVYLRI